MATKKATMTAEELLALPDNGFRHELIEGRLVTMPPTGAQHGASANKLAFLVTTFVLSHELGTVFAAETGFVLSRNPDTVRAPDVAYVSRERLPEGGLPANFLPFAPDLAAEVVSPRDRPRDVEAKARDWLRAGVRLVWVISPSERGVTVYETGKEARVLSSDDELTGEPVLPGFRCAVAELFR